MTGDALTVPVLVHPQLPAPAELLRVTGRAKPRRGHYDLGVDTEPGRRLEAIFTELSLAI